MGISTDIINNIPREDIFTDSLQKHLTFTLKNKVIKKGRLILFKKVHYYIQLTLLNIKGNRENFEIPIPFDTEYYNTDGENTLYFDYRNLTLTGNNKKMEESLKEYKIKNVEPSNYYNSILEITIN